MDKQTSEASSQCCWNNRKFKYLCPFCCTGTFDYEVDLFCTDFSKHAFLHSEVLYLGHRETERTDADQICQILSKNLDTRSLGYCTA